MAVCKRLHLDFAPAIANPSMFDTNPIVRHSQALT